MKRLLAAWLGAGMVACGTDDPLRLDVEAVEIGVRDGAARAYARAAARALERARATDDPAEREALLLPVLEAPVPAGMEGAVLLRLEVAELLCETWTRDAAGARRAVTLLSPMLAPDRTLPLDPVTARGLVCLGDAAAAAGRTDLAAESYLRAIRLMQMLQEEAMP